MLLQTKAMGEEHNSAMLRQGHVSCGSGGQPLARHNTHVEKRAQGIGLQQWLPSVELKQQRELKTMRYRKSAMKTLYHHPRVVIFAIECILIEFSSNLYLKIWGSTKHMHMVCF
jgi:hypothetical protein